MHNNKTLSRVIAIVVVVGLVATYLLPLLERPRPISQPATPSFNGPTGAPVVTGPSAPPPGK